MNTISSAISWHVDLKPFNSFGCKAEAKALAAFTGVEQIPLLLKEANLEQHLVLGGGSNVLFVNDYPGLILLNRIVGKRIEKQDDEHVWLRVGAGENWHQLVMYAVANGWGGIENLSLIPGNVGAAPMQNIGAYGAEVKSVIEEVEAWHIPSGTIMRFINDECRFGYRNSIFKEELKGLVAISSVLFKLSKKPVLNISYGAIEAQLKAIAVKELSLKAISDAVIAIRQSKLPDPAVIGNAGSFFKNPVVPNNVANSLKNQFPDMPSYPDKDGFTKLPAGWLIEQAGLKGYRKGDAGVHEKQALVLVNYGYATGSEILEVAALVEKKVSDMFGISLEKEVNII